MKGKEKSAFVSELEGHAQNVRNSGNASAIWLLNKLLKAKKKIGSLQADNDNLRALLAQSLEGGVSSEDGSEGGDNSDEGAN